MRTSFGIACSLDYVIMLYSLLNRNVTLFLLLHYYVMCCCDLSRLTYLNGTRRSVITPKLNHNNLVSELHIYRSHMFTSPVEKSLKNRHKDVYLLSLI